jgi:hypothetical protein
MGKKKQKTKHKKVSQVQMQYSFSNFFSMQVYFSCCLINVREKEKGLESSESAAHLPATVSQLLLEALLIADLRSELNTLLALQALFP